MPLEDDFSDILRKARTGHNWSVADLARLTGLPGADLTALERGDKPRDRSEVRALAAQLELRAEPLEQIVFDQWTPRPTPALGGIETIHGDVNGYAVKGYVVHDAGEALLVDTAYNAPAMIAFLDSRKLRLVGICLTHGHADHSDGLELLLKRWRVPVYLGSDDATLLRWQPPEGQLIGPTDGKILTIGRRSLRCMTTPGHTPGGISYTMDSETQPVCFVGDTLFAGSVGKSLPAILYPTHLDSVRRRVLKLPRNYVLLPGHGPATTVLEELEHNPFYAIQ